MSSPVRSISESSTIPDFNVVLFGAAKVGKSALVRRFLKNNFIEEYRPTVEETYSTVLQTMSCTCTRLVLIDTAGLHPFPAMRELRMRTGSAFVFVFAYDSTDSLHEAIRLHTDLQRVKGDKFDPKSVIFVGNKADVLTVPSIVEDGDGERVVGGMETEEESSRRSSGSVLTSAADELQTTARTLLDRLGCPLIDTSARLGFNVLEVFHSVLWPMLLANSNLAGRVTPADIASGHCGEDSPNRGPQETEALNKKISWPWGNASDHPAGLSISPNFSPTMQPSPGRSRMHTERLRKISCVENEILTRGTLLAAKEEVNRKFSIGSRLLPSPHGHNHQCRHPNCNNNLLAVNNTYNLPASRSHSVDNSLAEKVDNYRDSNSTGSVYSGRSYSSLSSVEKENFWKLSVSSDTRCRYGRLLSPSPKRTSRDCELVVDTCLHSLDFVQEVGYYLDPSHRPEDTSEPRVPQAPCLQVMNMGRRGRSPQQLSSLPSIPRERVKKRSVFSQSNFCLVDQICEANESTSPRSEHEFNLIVPESHRKGISGSGSKASNCKIS
uniref:GTP binding protein Di Ras2 n=1 Tax=Echinococcus granulosus TaxID=6210 RepID=A0A068WAB7_ECHGR|nr:GTP binding protein Di Ras2 [Echinococcus granulosus]